jgi:5-(carboxyamino)imidazole ribonucleotide synthase
MQPIAPGSTIGILGGGQLGRMLAIAAARFGYRCHIYAPEQDPPASEVAAHTTRAGYTDADAMARFAAACAVVTYEFENIPFEPVAAIAQKVAVRPGVEALRITQDRLFEKTFCNERGVATAPFRAVASVEDLKTAIAELGLPLVLKTRRMGYDGKGQVKLERADQAEAAFTALKSDALIAEGFVAFQRELSVVLARNADGCIVSWGPVENIHRNHILWRTYAPARLSDALRSEAERIAATLAEGLDYVGVLAVELFDPCDLRPAAGQRRTALRCGHGESDRRRNRRLGRPAGRAENQAASLRENRSPARPEDGPCEPALPLGQPATTISDKSDYLIRLRGPPKAV